MIARTVGAGLGALTIIVATALPAVAHVEVQPAEAAAGGPATFSFRVPNERDDAATVSLAVHLPTDHPIPGVTATPKASWTSQVTADTVTWSGGRIEPGHAEYFTLETGPLPTDTETLVFPADQSYSTGAVVAWNEIEVGGAEPAHPAPVLKLTGAVVTVASAPAGPPFDSGTAAHVHAPTSAAHDGDGPPVALIVGASAVAVAVVAAGVVALTRAPWRRATHR
jgi:periplasmic copper chaperone A